MKFLYPGSVGWRSAGFGGKNWDKPPAQKDMPANENNQLVKIPWHNEAAELWVVRGKAHSCQILCYPRLWPLPCHWCNFTAVLDVVEIISIPMGKYFKTHPASAVAPSTSLWQSTQHGFPQHRLKIHIFKLQVFKQKLQKLALNIYRYIFFTIRRSVVTLKINSLAPIPRLPPL